MSILAGCMAVLGLFVLVLVLLLLIYDVRESNERARQHQENHKAILRELKRKEDIDWFGTHPRCGPPT